MESESQHQSEQTSELGALNLLSGGTSLACLRFDDVLGALLNMLEPSL